MGANTNIVRIPTPFGLEFLTYWFNFLEPFHNLTKKESEIAARFLYYRFELADVISDEDILDKVLMSDDTKKKIMADCNISNAYFQVIMVKLRRHKIILDGKINKRFIPNVDKGAESFKLTLFFDFSEK